SRFWRISCRPGWQLGLQEYYSGKEVWYSSRIGAQQLAQTPEAAAQQPGHGRFGSSQFRSDVGHGPLLQVMLFNDQPLILRQLAQRLGQATQVFLAHYLLTGRPVS